jgi:hypothetical protein
VKWFNWAQNMDNWQEIVNAVMYRRFLENKRNFLTSRGTTSFSRQIVLHVFTEL